MSCSTNDDPIRESAPPTFGMMANAFKAASSEVVRSLAVSMTIYINVEGESFTTTVAEEGIPR